jgi:hypothetical protein
VNFASSSSISAVTTLLSDNKELPPALKTASHSYKKPSKVSCVDVPDEDDSLFNNVPTPNGELLLHLDDLPSTVSPPLPPDPKPQEEKLHHPIYPSFSNSEDILTILSDDKFTINDHVNILLDWSHKSRSQEVDSSLVHTLIGISKPLANQVLMQLREPRAILRTVEAGEYKDKSLVVQTFLRSPDGQFCVSDDSSLIDCGASGRGYISSSFVDLHSLPCTPLPYPIPIYNVDGSQNIAGAINRLCTMDMRIGGHNERITFRVTETGSSNIILGLDWLRLHDPLVNWSKGKLSFFNCPPHSLQSSNLCSGSSIHVTLPPSAEELGPDADFCRSVFDCNSPQELLVEWDNTLRNELGPEDEALLCVDVNNPSSDSTHPKDVRVTEHLRLTKDRSNSIDKYLKDFAPVFSQSGFDELPPRRTWDHAIELKPSEEAKPISSKVYALSRSEQVELDKFLDEHLKTGRIRPSKSPIASPFFFVKKKDGSLRPVQDYRRLNEITIRNRYPLPLVSELMDKLKGAKYFTKLDVRWGYENIRIKEGDEWKAAFVTNRGLFEPTVMFFGLTNSPATFQNMMNDIFRDLLLAGHVIIYMDDILIFTDDLATHQLITRQVLSVLEKHNLFLKPEKCSFEALEVEYLGVVISQGQLKMDPKKIEALETWPVPRCKKDVQQFLGFVNFYRRFVKDFAKISRPLNRLCGSSPWTWTSLENDAFLSLRQSVVLGPILAIPLDDAPFRVEADSSGYATGAVLSQLQDTEWRPVAFSSKALSDVERNYDIHDRELLSIMRALADWRKYLHGSSSPFEIHSDHKNLQYFMTSQKLNRRQARWSLELSEFNFTLLHKPGSSMICADALSRRPDYDKGLADNDSVTLLNPDCIRRSVIEYLPSPIVEDIRLQANDNLALFQKNSSSPGWHHLDGLTTWYNRIVVPDTLSLRERVIKENHDSILAGHPGRTKTVELVQRDFWWPSVSKDCHKYVDGCATCQRTKPLRQKPLGLLSPNEVPENFWQIISCDFVTDLPSSKGFNSVMVCVDRLSKMVRLIPCHKTISSETAAKKFRDHVWKDFGLPGWTRVTRGYFVSLLYLVNSHEFSANFKPLII